MKSPSVVRQRERSDLVKLTAFLLLAAAFTYWVGAVTADLRPGSRVEYKAVFADVSGLKVGDPVRIAGVEVGKVAAVYVQPNANVLVTFDVPRSTVLNASTEATIQYSNLIGDRIVELTRPDRSAAALPVGATIPVSRTRPALDLDSLLNGFKPLFEGLVPQNVNALSTALVEVLQGQTAALNTLLTRAGAVTATIGDRQELVGEVIRNLNTVVGAFDQRRSTVAQLVDQMSAFVHGLHAQDTQILDSAVQIRTFADEAALLLIAARGALKPDLINLARAASGVNANAKTLVAVLQRLPRHYAAIQDTASYGDFFDLYLCGVRLETDAGTTPWLMSAAARCK